VDWNDLKAFEAIAQAGSLTEAARRTGMSIATLSRRLEHLESKLSLRLVQRSPLGIDLTQDGRALFAATHETQNSVDAVLRLAQSLAAGEMRPPVRVSATETVITTMLAPNLHHLPQSGDAIAVDLIVSNENANLSKREADIAIRLARPAQETLLAKKIATISTSLYAAPAYVSAHEANLHSPKDQSFILYGDQFGEISEVAWARKHGLLGRAKMLSSSTLAMLEAVKCGSGIGLLPDYLAGAHDLQRVDFPAPPARSLWLVFHRTAKSDPRMQSVRRWIVESVKSRLVA